MKSLSVCMIVRDEEKTIERCLNSIKNIADEIIIVDTGSVDNTKNICKKFTDKIYDFVWVDDFSKARNYSFSLASCDYIMWLDADDVVLEKDSKKIINFKKSEQEPDVLMLKYITAFDENLNPEFSFYRERIVKRSMNFSWAEPVHEVITPRGNVKYVDIAVYHMKQKVGGSGKRNLNIYEAQLANGVKLSPRAQFYYARELFYNNRLDEAIIEFNKFLTSRQGWVENNIEACLNLAKCYQRKGDIDKALTSLFGSFGMGAPRGEILCEIGAILMSIKKYDEAIIWFRLAKKVKPNIKSGAFVSGDSYDFIPNLQLCVCYYNKGKKSLAKLYHEKCKSLKPKHPSVIHNEKFFI